MPFNVFGFFYPFNEEWGAKQHYPQTLLVNVHFYTKNDENGKGACLRFFFHYLKKKFLNLKKFGPTWPNIHQNVVQGLNFNGIYQFLYQGDEKT